MDEIDNLILQLAQTYPEPETFINVLENLSIPANEKGSMFLGIGIKLFNFSYFRLALVSWENALKYFIQNKDRAGESACYGGLGAAYANLGDFRKAIKYHENSLKINKEIGDKVGESGCYTNLGIAYGNLGNFKKAIKYHEDSLKIAHLAISICH